MKLILSFLAVCLLLAATASGQTKAQGKSTAKTFTIHGKVSPDGKLLIGKNGESWSVTNPASLAGHEGQFVKVKYQLTQVSQNINVVSLKILNSQTKGVPNPGDAAFRR